MAYDSQSGQLVYFVGYNPSTGADLAETWAWSGTAWKQLHPATSPSPRSGAALAYDAGTKQLILFGGYGKSGALDGTYSWTGTTWTLLDPATSPSARGDADMAYDTSTGQFLLYGGETSANSILSDTWNWNGTTWTQLDPDENPPPGRVGESMAYDADSNQVVLFGGFNNDEDGGSWLGDTWAWNGTSWTQLDPANSPVAREGASMAYDSHSETLVLFGGESNNGQYRGHLDLERNHVECPIGDRLVAPQRSQHGLRRCHPPAGAFRRGIQRGANESDRDLERNHLGPARPSDESIPTLKRLDGLRPGD